MNLFTKNLQQLSKSDTSTAGGKASSLGELLNAGIQAPEGFAILTHTFEKFLQATNLTQEIQSLLSTADKQKVHIIESVSETITNLILSQEIPAEISLEILENFKLLDAQFVAVRSSATAEDGADHAWAGQLDSYLNVTQADLLEKVKHCWASLFTPRAIFYGIEKNLDSTKISVAVIVQKMVEADSAGVGFSVHPVTENVNQIIVEAGYGLGEAVVSGTITPDSYIVSKNPLKVISINVSSQEKGLFKLPNGGNEWKAIPESLQNSQVLTRNQIYELSKQIIRIEEFFGFPCDIEWAYQNDKLYILQSRPITTLGQNPVQKDSNQNQEYELHFRQTDFPLLFSSIVFRPENYGAFDYLILQENTSIAGYLSPTGVAQAHEFSKELLDENIASTKIRLLEEFLDDLKNNHTINKLASIHASDFFARWEIVESLCNKIGQYYRFCENPMVSALEEEVIEACPRNEDLLKVLQDPEIADQLGFTNTQKRYLHRLIHIGELKFHIHHNFGPIFDALDSLLQDISNHYNIDLIYLLNSTDSELKDIILNSKLPDIETIKTRLTGLLYRPQQQPIFATGQEYTEAKNKLEPTNITEVKGIVAYAGIGKGKAKIHLSLLSGEEIPPNTVLVAGMTNPQIVPYLNNAVGIITDEGGLTCHAAIISRELKIPCLIGTKIATQIFKNGQQVTVNANNAIAYLTKNQND